MQILAIASGKGGVGKSMIASNLSLALAQANKKVIIVDLDLGGSNLHLSLGQIGLPYGVGTYLDNPTTKIDKIIYETEYENLYFIPGEAELPGIANVLPEAKSRLMNDLMSLECDYLIMDLGAGTHFSTIDFFLLSGQGIIVTTPTLTATLNAYLFIKNSVFRIMNSQFKKKSEAKRYLDKLRKDGISLQKIYLTKLQETIKKIDPESYQTLMEGLSHLRPKLIMNMVENPNDARKANKLRHSCRQYMGIDLEHLGIVSYDEIQSRALNSRLPVVSYKPRAVISQAIYRIAEKIMDMETDSSSPLGHIDPDESFKVAESEAEDDFDARASSLEELLHCGALSESDMIETIKTQQYEINQLKLENQWIKKKLIEAAEKGYGG